MEFRTVECSMTMISTEATVARREAPRSAWISLVSITVVIAIIAISFGRWIELTVAIMLFGLVSAYSIFRMHKEWLCVLDRDKLLIRAVAPSLFLGTLVDRGIQPRIVGFSAAEIVRANSLLLELEALGGNICTKWLVLEVTPNALQAYIASAKELH